MLNKKLEEFKKGENKTNKSLIKNLNLDKRFEGDCSECRCSICIVQ